MCGEVERAADALGIPTTANRALSLSGDDFAEYLLQTKGAYAYLGTANPKKPHTCISNHRGDFDIDEETLPLGTALYAAYALSVLIRSLPNNCFFDEIALVVCKFRFYFLRYSI